MLSAAKDLLFLQHLPLHRVTPDYSRATPHPVSSPQVRTRSPFSPQDRTSSPKKRGNTLETLSTYVGALHSVLRCRGRCRKIARQIAGSLGTIAARTHHLQSELFRRARASAAR